MGSAEKLLLSNDSDLGVFVADPYFADSDNPSRCVSLYICRILDDHPFRVPVSACVFVLVLGEFPEETWGWLWPLRTGRCFSRLHDVAMACVWSSD
ncbi:MAG TPA: hypothetical protein VG097_16940, partial [Gemmata sp.]|nr:hypothetical protein [Gemmata sp.]